MPFIFGTSTEYRTFSDALRDVVTGRSIHAAAINAAGTGYVVGDVLTVAGGTATIAATIEVLAVGGSGELTTIRVLNAGLYTVDPTTTANAVTGGTGSGGTIDLTVDDNGWTERRSLIGRGAIAVEGIGAAGTGYMVSDVVTLAAGTGSPEATFEVTSIGGGGAVTGLTVLTPGSYATNPSGAVATTGGSGSGLTIDPLFSGQSGGNSDRTVILEGAGSGSDEIFVGYRSFFDSGSGARNIVMNGFTGFNAALPYEDQPGRSPGLETSSTGVDFGGAYILLGSTTVTWWISVTPRRIVGVARLGSCYSSFHLGFINPFATAGEWSYPILVMGTSSDRFRLPSSSIISTSGIADPVKHNANHDGPGLIRSPDGVWRSVFNSSGTSSGRTANTTGITVAPNGNLTGVSKLTGDDWYATTFDGTDMSPQSNDPGTQNIRLLPTENGSEDYFIRFPSTLIWSSGSVPGGIHGEMDGVFWFEAATLVVAENRLRDSNDRFRVFQSGVRSDNWALWCLKES